MKQLIQMKNFFKDERTINTNTLRPQNEAKSILEFESNTIDEILSSLGFEGVFVSKAISNKSSNIYHLRITPSTKIHLLLKVSEEIAYGLGKTNVRIARDGGIVQVEVAKESKTKSNNLISLLNSLKSPQPFCAILGMDMKNNPLAIRITSPEIAHILIVGQTGSGKTALTRSIICSLAYLNKPRNIQFVLIDPKSSGFAPLVKLPHALGEIIKTPEEAFSMLNYLVEEMINRDHNKEETKNKPKLIVAIDELSDLIMAKQELKEPITRLCQRGRESGIHIIACTQKPVAAVLGGPMLSNFPVRLCGAVASKGEARFATGIANSGAEKLEGKGDFLLVKSGFAERFRGTWLSSEDFNAVLRKTTSGNGNGATR